MSLKKKWFYVKRKIDESGASYSSDVLLATHIWGVIETADQAARHVRKLEGSGEYIFLELPATAKTFAPLAWWYININEVADKVVQLKTTWTDFYSEPLPDVVTPEIFQKIMAASWKAVSILPASARTNIEKPIVSRKNKAGRRMSNTTKYALELYRKGHSWDEAATLTEKEFHPSRPSLTTAKLLIKRRRNRIKRAAQRAWLRQIETNSDIASETNAVKSNRGSSYKVTK
ncbi:MAG: hypothetical protein SF097_14835 [Acidobacteriota bacterium]|nr:hypothetical protein [Acidobacteriota bacterium]